MSKSRVITGFGPSAYTLTHSATSAAAAVGDWLRFGPFKGSNFCFRPVFEAGTSSGDDVAVEAVMSETSDPSTDGVVTLVSAIDSSDSGLHKMSTEATVFSFIRFVSTCLAYSTASLAATRVTCNYSALAG